MCTGAEAFQMAGASAQAGSSFASSQGTKDAYGIQAQIAENNALIAGWQAADALARGDRAASNSKIQSNQLKGTQRAAMGANGVDMGVGSALQVLTDTDFFGQVDADTIKNNAAREAWALREQANGFRSEASLFQTRANAENPWMAAGTSLLTSGGKVADRWYSSGSTPTSSSNWTGMDYQARRDY